jgi:hypothetical protein
MTTRRKVTRVEGQQLPSLGTPLSQSGFNTMTATFADGTPSYSTLRLRTDFEMYVVAGGGTGDASLAFAYETVIMVGGQMTQGGLATSSRIPITDANFTPGTFELGDWVQWEYLYPEIQFVNTLVPQLILVTWRPKGGTIDTQARRRNDQVGGIDLWMPYEVQDGSGLIGTTDANGNTYELGLRFAQTLFWSGRS